MLKFVIPAALIAVAVGFPVELEDEGGMLFQSVRNESDSLFPNRVFGLSFSVGVGTPTNSNYTQRIHLAFATASTSTFIGKLGFITELEGLERMPVNGQLGLAWVPYSEPPAGPTTPLIFGLLPKGPKKYMVYSDVHRHVFCLGCERIDECPRNEVKFAYILIGKPLPMLFVKSVQIGKYHLATGFPALFDANVNSVLMPAEPLNAAIKLYGAQFDSKLGVYLVECKSGNIDWNFEFIGLAASLSNDQFVVYTGRDDGKCVLLVGQSVGAEPTYTLGSPLFFKYCVTFDVDANRIGIVKAVKNMH